jgi:hypothetical protein
MKGKISRSPISREKVRILFKSCVSMLFILKIADSAGCVAVCLKVRRPAGKFSKKRFPSMEASQGQEQVPHPDIGSDDRHVTGMDRSIVPFRSGWVTYNANLTGESLHVGAAFPGSAVHDSQRAHILIILMPGAYMKPADFDDLMGRLKVDAGAPPISR